MTQTKNYNQYLIESLKDPTEATAYLWAILQEENPEPELLKVALENILEALGETMAVRILVRTFIKSQNLVGWALPTLRQCPNLYWYCYRLKPHEIQLQKDKIDEILNQSGSNVIYSLVAWLNKLGLELTVTISEDSSFIQELGHPFSFSRNR